MRVDIWSDVVCPFCYIGKKRLENVAAEAGIDLEIIWHSFELDQNAPAKHDTSNTERLAKKYGRTIKQTQEMERNITEVAASEGITFNWEQAILEIRLMHIVLFILHKAKVWGMKQKKRFSMPI